MGAADDETTSLPDPLTTPWTPDQVAVMVNLRQWALAYHQLNLQLAAWLGLPVSDANAVGLIVWAAEADEPLSPSQLAEQLGFTSGAVSILLRRLESAGLLNRQRRPEDLRRVVLHPSAAARNACRRFLSVAGHGVSDLLHRTSPDDTRLVAGFLRSLSLTTAEAADGLRRSAL